MENRKPLTDEQEKFGSMLDSYLKKSLADKNPGILKIAIVRLIYMVVHITENLSKEELKDAFEDKVR